MPHGHTGRIPHYFFHRSKSCANAPAVMLGSESPMYREAIVTGYLRLATQVDYHVGS
jgi:hypothetical protein